MSEAKQGFDATRHLDAMSATLDLPIPPERRAGVEQFLKVAFAMSEVLKSAPVDPDHHELAAVFRPGSVTVKP
jgi:hypothetical protein